MRAIKAICGSRYRRGCLSCGRIIEMEKLRDNEDYICPACRQLHHVDIYIQPYRRIVLTAEGHEDIRRRIVERTESYSGAMAARHKLIMRAGSRQQQEH